jgi:hypothetical protein
MNIHVKKIEQSLTDIQSALKELQIEDPYITTFLPLGYGDIMKLEPWKLAETLQQRLNVARLRKIALEKLTPQDREILGLY